MSFGHLQVVLWKNIHIRRYYRILTFLEFVIPIVIFYQGLSFRDHLQPIDYENKTSGIHISLNDAFKNCCTTILYTPNNSFTYDIIKSLGVALSE